MKPDICLNKHCSSTEHERVKKYSQEVFDHHNTTKEEFDISYDYYLKSPEELEALLELVFEEFNKLESEASKYNAEKEISDSTLIVP